MGLGVGEGREVGCCYSDDSCVSIHLDVKNDWGVDTYMSSQPRCPRQILLVKYDRMHIQEVRSLEQLHFGFEEVRRRRRYLGQR